MQQQRIRRSIIRAGIRAFVVSVASVIGIGLALIPVMGFFAFLFGKSEENPERETRIEVLATAKRERKPLGETAPVILLLDVRGMIGLDGLKTHFIERLLTESREGPLKGDRVKAIVLNINTPGGSVFDSDGIYRAIQRYKREFKVPVIAYVDGLCASGGYYIAAAADEITAADTSMFGSIGVVVSPFFNVSSLMEKLGIESHTISSGEGKDVGNPYRPWRKDEWDNLADMVNYHYDRFVNIVLTSRPEVSEEHLRSEYGAKIFAAPLAKEYGLVDKTGYFLCDAVELAKEKAGIETEDYRVIRLEDKQWWRTFFFQETRAPAVVEHRVQVPALLQMQMEHRFLYLHPI